MIRADLCACWTLVAVFAAKLTADGVLLHLLTPYSSGPLVLEQGDTTPPRWVTFHPRAWVLAVLINVGGVCAHFQAATRRFPTLLDPPVAISLTTIVAALLWRRAKGASRA